MEWINGGSMDGVPIRVPTNADYRTFAACSGDCDPDLSYGSDELRTRIAFTCPSHGIQSLIDPFESDR